jgi:hypothetical protein
MNKSSVIVVLAIVVTLAALILTVFLPKIANGAPSNVRFERNSFGGYNVYQNGKMIYRTHANNRGSQNVYGKTGKLEFRGQSGPKGSGQSFQKNAK